MTLSQIQSRVRLDGVALLVLGYVVQFSISYTSVSTGNPTPGIHILCWSIFTRPVHSGGPSSACRRTSRYGRRTSEDLDLNAIEYALSSFPRKWVWLRWAWNRPHRLWRAQTKFWELGGASRGVGTLLQLVIYKTATLPSRFSLNYQHTYTFRNACTAVFYGKRSTQKNRTREGVLKDKIDSIDKILHNVMWWWHMTS